MPGLDVRAVYPQIDPYDHGMLAVGDGNHVYWEVCGNPGGTPALVLHGGPGSGCSASMRRYFDPAVYRIVLFDQRNCGRSTPHASDPSVSLAANTTRHLLADIELLREHLGITRWLVFGWSWGSALALAYAERHTSRVAAAVLTGVGTGRRTELELFTWGLGGLFPDAWRRFRDGVPAAAPDSMPAAAPDSMPAAAPDSMPAAAPDSVPAATRDETLPAAYARLLGDPDPAVREKAARDWCDWEEAILPTSGHNPRYDDPAFRLAFTRIVTHYWSNDHFLHPDGVLLTEAGRLGSVPAALIQGTLDLTNLVGTPWLLAAAWPNSDLQLIDDAGHGGSARLLSAIVTATDAFATDAFATDAFATGAIATDAIATDAFATDAFATGAIATDAFATGAIAAPGGRRD